jgi:hypothetical protein
VHRIAARLAVFVLALVAAGCGSGGGGGGSDAAHAGVDAFPDVLEIARAELGEDAVLSEVAVAENAISFDHVRFGSIVRVVYNTHAVFVGNERVRKKPNPAATFPISDVSADAPAKLLGEIQEREEGSVSDFGVTLERSKSGDLTWNAKATVNGARKSYEGNPDGTLRG